MAKRTCRACGVSFEYPEPGSLATKRLCTDCARLPEGVRAVLERHQLELTRLKRQVEKLSEAARAN